MKKTVILFIIFGLTITNTCWAQTPSNEYYPDRSPKTIWAEIPDSNSISFKEYYPNEALKAEGIYADGKLNGTYREYSQESKLHIEADYSKGKLQGLYKEYYNNGEIKKKAFYRNGQLDGPLKSYFKNGKIEMLLEYYRGKLDGSSIVYHPNGKIREEANYIDGKLEGAFKSYYSSGKLKSHVKYRKDKREGLFEAFYEDGSKSEEGLFLNNAIQLSKTFGQDGRLLREESLGKDGKRRKTVNIYSSEGKLQSKELYVDDELVEVKSYGQKPVILLGDAGLAEGKTSQKVFDRNFLMITLLLTIVVVALSILLKQLSAESSGEVDLEKLRQEQKKKNANSATKKIKLDNREAYHKYFEMIDNEQQKAGYVANVKGNILYANDLFAEIIDYPSTTEAIGININEFFSDFGLNEYTFFMGFKESNEVSGYKFKLKNSSMDTVRIAHGRKIFDENGEHIGIMGHVTEA